MFIELSYPLSPDTPVFPGLPQDEFHPHTRMKNGDESNTTMISHFTHNGTHVDAPYHFYIHGKTIDEIPIEDFYYTKPLLIKKKLSKGEFIKVDDLKEQGSDLNKADILLLRTGYFDLRSDKKAYSDDFPSLSLEAAVYIRNELMNIKAVAIDTLSIESCVEGPRKDFCVHKALLASNTYTTRTILIYEDVNLGVIEKDSVKKIYAFPLRLVGIDGSPVTIIAEK